MTTPTYTSPTTWAAGNVPTAAQFNAQLRDNVNYLATPVAAQAARQANQSIGSASFTAVTLVTSEGWDTDSIHSTSSNPSRFTVPTGQDGIYLVIAMVAFANNTTGGRMMRVTKNGAALVTDPGAYLDHVPASGTGSQPVILQGSREIDLAAGDYIEIEVYQDSGGALNVTDATVSFRKVSL